MLLVVGSTSPLAAQAAPSFVNGLALDGAALDASSIQCPLDLSTGCIASTGGAAALWSSSYQLLPGVLHAYTVTSAELGNYITPVPEPTTGALMLGGLAGFR